MQAMFTSFSKQKTEQHILSHRSGFSIDKMALQGICLGIGEWKPASSA
jgi:hypothetical protein